jgi:hypothetical protein
MLKLTNKTIETGLNDGACTHTRYACEGYVECDGSSIWEYEGDLRVNVSAIDIFEEDYLGDGDVSTMIYVEHDTDWRIYTDKGFEAAISDALGFEVMFTEQGMQDNGVASLEC